MLCLLPVSVTILALGMRADTSATRMTAARMKKNDSIAVHFSGACRLKACYSKFLGFVFLRAPMKLTLFYCKKKHYSSILPRHDLTTETIWKVVDNA